jgi:hypothetical protein
MKTSITLTEAERNNLIYAINLNLDSIEYEQGLRREEKSLKNILAKLGGERQYS